MYFLSLKNHHYPYNYFFSNLKVSNEVAEQPVISQVSGYIYEKRLVLKYLNENGTDPMNGQVLTAENLIEVKNSKFNQPHKNILKIENKNYIFLLKQIH